MRLTFPLIALVALAPSAAEAQPFQPKLVNAGPVFVDFGSVNVGTTVTVPVSIRNLTTSPLNLAGGGVGGGVGFSAVPGGSTCTQPIPAGATCTLMYRFRPIVSDGSLREDATAISFSDGIRSQQVAIAFAGRGNGSLVHVAPRSIDFGDLLLGDTATVKVFIVNIGTENVSFAGGGFPTSNGFFGNSGCGVLTPGGTCFQAYSFSPSQLGEVQNSASLGAVIPSPQFSQGYSIGVRGRGVSTAPLVSFFPISFDFGDVTVGTESILEVKYKNLGGTPVTYAGGAISAPFDNIPTTGPGCPSSGANAGATCTFLFHFRPLSTGPASGSTSLTFSRPGASQTVDISVSGNGIGQVGRVSPTTMDFGDVRLGTAISAPVTITNTTRLPLTGFIGGGVFPPFSSSHNCPASLPVGQSCQYTFTFTANANSFGPRTAVTSLSFSNADNVQPVYPITVRAAGFDQLFAHSFE